MVWKRYFMRVKLVVIIGQNMGNVAWLKWNSPEYLKYFYFSKFFFLKEYFFPRSLFGNWKIRNRNSALCARTCRKHKLLFEEAWGNLGLIWGLHIQNILTPRVHDLLDRISGEYNSLCTQHSIHYQSIYCFIYGFIRKYVTLEWRKLTMIKLYVTVKGYD